MSERYIDNTTRTYPRTLSEAFGPHTSTKIEEAGAPLHKADAIVVCACALAAVVVAVLYLLGVIA